MAALLTALLAVVKVAIISGGALPQFTKQVLAHLPPGAHLNQLSLLPTCGTRFFQYQDGWQKLYAEDLTEPQKHKIVAELEKAVAASGFQASKVWGAPIEDRESQITYSALGQDAPLNAKKAWDPDFAKRKKIKAILDVSLAEFSVRLGGRRPSTSRCLESTKPMGSESCETSSASRSKRCCTLGMLCFRAGMITPPEEPARGAFRSGIRTRRSA